MKKQLSILFMLLSFSMLNARQITLKISYKGMPACYQNIDLKVGNSIVASGKTNRQGELKTSLSFGINDVDVSGKKGNSSWYANGVVRFENNYYHLKLEDIEKIMKEEMGNMQGELNQMGGLGSFAGDVLNSSTTNMFSVTDECGGSSLNTSTNNSPSSNNKGGFTMTSSTRSTKTVNGVVVEDERTNSTVSNDGFNSTHSKYEDGEYSETTINGEGTNGSSGAIGETASLIGETTNLLNAVKLTPEEKAQREEAQRQKKIEKYQKKLDETIAEKAKKEVELKENEFDREEERQVLQNEIKLLEIEGKLQEHDLIKFRDGEEKLSANEIAQLESDYKNINEENETLKQNIKIADSGISGVKLSKLKVDLASKKAKLKMTLNKKKKAKIQKEIDELEKQIQDIEKMREE